MPSAATQRHRAVDGLKNFNFKMARTVITEICANPRDLTGQALRCVL